MRRARGTLASGLFVLAAISFAGCESKDAKKGRPLEPADTGAGSPTPGAIVYLRARTDGQRATVDVVARGAGEIHGMAFRLHWDPAKLTFIEARGSDAWSKQAVQLAKEGLPGELVVVWTEKGAAGARASADETVLGSLDFTANERVALAFRPERSTLRRSGGPAEVAEWRGIEIAPP